MRVKTSRNRGRPRGKYRSSADSRLLESLVLISMKYKIDFKKFFESLVEAWEGQESPCEGLSINCRKKTRDNAVFLITKSSMVVAQFPMPKHLLEETSSFKMFVRTKAPEKTIPKKIKIENPRIEDLKSGMNQINLEARVLEIPKPRSVFTRFGRFAVVTNASIADETGVIQLPLWDNQIEAVSVGDLIRVENAHVVTYKGEHQLRMGRGGQLSIVEKGNSSFRDAF